MSDLLETIRRTLVPIHKEGYPFILIGIVLTVLFGYFAQFAGWIFLILTLWGLLFLPRSRAGDPGGGRPGGFPGRRPGELDLHRAAAARTRPAAGADDPDLGLHERVRLPREPRSRDRQDRPDRLHARPVLNAELDKASDDNERNGLVIETTHRGSPLRVGVVQIAGLVARRIVGWVQATIL